jgi:aryl carrier-like protein
MRVLLVDADSANGFPNLALMKLSAWLKQRGDSVDLVKGIPTTPPLERYDQAFGSCIFFQNRERFVAYMESLSCPYQAGGSGFDLKGELLEPIEHMRPDYDLYPTAFSLGFTSRGCIRKCGFCIVPEKEGHIRDHAPISEFHKAEHNKLLLLDNNFLASPKWKDNLTYIQENDLHVNFNQGLDIRLVNEEVAGRLASVKTMDWKFKRRGLHFAFDSLAVEKAVRKGISYLLTAGFKAKDLMFYVLVGYDTEEQEDLYRIETLRELGVMPYVMPFNSSSKPYVKKLARWVNRCYYQFIPYADFRLTNPKAISVSGIAGNRRLEAAKK